jgi:hypothetical protein
MLSTTLNTNEIKNAAAVEQEFGRLSNEGRTAEYALLTESPGLQHRLSIKHREVGSGVDTRRQSVIRFHKEAMGQIDTTRKTDSIAQITVDIPIGNISDYTVIKDVLAELQSFVATTGAATTVLFDCTGNGAATLVNGSL